MIVPVFSIKLGTMYTRFLEPPKKSILLFGPRGTGKSTWIAQHFPKARTYDLLDTREAMRFSRDPGLFYDELEDFKPGTWVVVDEIQKVPAILDEVHRLIEKKQLKFVLSGSSARKLKHGASNLLAGRALTVQMFPLVSAEVSFKIKFPDFFTNGMLPMAYTDSEPLDYLQSYVSTYLNEEIKAEALTKNIGAFARFLEVAARQNAQMTNFTNIARDTMVERTTVENYFQILVDTLMGYYLRPWKLKSSNKQVSHSKFYFFDAGVARALSGRLPYPPTQEELGVLVETAILSEIRAYLAYNKLHYQIHFWRNYDGNEVDVLCETKKGFVAIEIKASGRWDKKFNRGLEKIRDAFGAGKLKCFGVFQGRHALSQNSLSVYPVMEFLKDLWQGDIL